MVRVIREVWYTRVDGKGVGAWQAREREHMLQRERQHLKQLMKLENVERVKRIKEYKRLEVRARRPMTPVRQAGRQPGRPLLTAPVCVSVVQILKKIHDAAERMEFMFQQKQDIIAQVRGSRAY